MSLQGKTAIITGAGRGIGRATALRFAAAGAQVVLAARTEEQIHQVAEEVADLAGVALAVPTDVTVESEVKSLVEQAESRFGSVDILVNNAGEMTLCPIHEMTVEDWHRIINANLLSAFLCTRAVLPSMIERRAGRIINVGSLAGRRGYPEQGAYSAAKHALYGLTKVLSIECQPYGIRVNMVSPGGVLTDFSKDLLATRPASEVAEWMTPEEVADAICFVATQEGAAQTDELVLRRFSSDPWR